MQLENKVVIITGASMGIGAATAREFAQAGCKVVLAARSEQRLNALAQDHIRVITVYPGETQTGFFNNTLDGGGRAAVTGRERRMDPPEHVARTFVEGARREPREVYMSGGSRVFGLIGVLMPQVFEGMMRGRVED
jgi:short-subunit dehydrogenase